MMWSICLALSIATVIISVMIIMNIGGLRRARSFQYTIYSLGGGVFISGVFVFYPIYSQIFEDDSLHAVKSVLISIYSTIQLFIVGGDFSIILEYTEQLGGRLYNAYVMWASVLFLAAPLLTFGFVLSLFQNFLAFWKFILAFHRDLFVFSELNEKSLTLARSLKENNERRRIVFTNCSAENEDAFRNWTVRAKEIGAVRFRGDIPSVNFHLHSKKRELNFFVLEEDDSEVIRKAAAVIDEYGDLSQCALYLFSDSIESELFMNSLDKRNVKVRRINESRTFVYRLLYDCGQNLFQNVFVSKNNEKVINAVIVGLGNFGTEMLKALPWFCQMDGYSVEIHAYDKNSKAESIFKTLCPELMDEKHNQNTLDGEAQYSITIHSGIDVTSFEFLKAVSELIQPTYVFVALGDDSLNVKVALEIRRQLLKNGISPNIQAVITSAELKKIVGRATDYKGNAYGIEAVGDLNTTYSEDTVMHLDIEMEALARHKKYCKTAEEAESFWKYEYNYYSSMASVLHKKMKVFCHISGIEKSVAERTDKECECIRKLEHRRWNAYMRSEGYCYGVQRNDLAKLHPCLVPFDELPEDEKKKDDD